MALSQELFCQQRGQKLPHILEVSIQFGAFDFDFKPRSPSAAPLTIPQLAGWGIRGCCPRWNMFCSGSHIPRKSALPVRWLTADDADRL
jgi:hypothetical protein